jgi:hypothetical protein
MVSETAQICNYGLKNDAAVAEGKARAKVPVLGFDSLLAPVRIAGFDTCQPRYSKTGTGEI